MPVNSLRRVKYPFLDERLGNAEGGVSVGRYSSGQPADAGLARPCGQVIRTP